MLPTDPAPFADGAALVADALGAYLQQQRVSVPDHAAATRWLDNRGGGYVGRWSHDEAPYLVGPMAALDGMEHTTVAVVGPGRCGKTAIAENWLLRNVENNPADMLWYEPTDDALASYVKRVIDPMIALHDGLKSRLGTAPIDRSIHFKRFGPMWVEFLPGTYSNLIGKSAPFIVLDELDAYSDRDGDVYRLADVRRQTFGVESKILAVSHPDQADGIDPSLWTRGIMRLYGDSTRRTWWWPCPHCNAFSSPAPTAARVMALHYPEAAPLDEIADAARLLCPSCGGLIEDRWRRPMNMEGRWVADGESLDEDGKLSGAPARRDIDGYWITGVMSPFILGGIGALARDLVSAERGADATGEERPVRDVMAKRLGVPATPRRRVGSLDAGALADRAEAFELRAVPQGVRFLTAFMDVQANRFELLVRGWGVGGESWIIDAARIEAEPAHSAADWDRAIQAALLAEYPLADGSGRVMRVRAAGFDSGGVPGVTEQAYAAWRRWRAGRRALLMGKVGGRDAWTLLPCKGQSAVNAGRLAVVYPDSARKDRHTGVRGEVPLGLFNANLFKDALSGQLGQGEAGAQGYVHIPAALRSAAPPHAWFEQLTAERRTPRGTWEKIGRANEALDLMVGCHVMAHLHGLARMDWARPPGWAAPWEANTAVGVPSASPPPPLPHAPILARTPVNPPQGPAFRPPPMPPMPVGFNPAARRAPQPVRLA